MKIDIVFHGSGIHVDQDQFDVVALMDGNERALHRSIEGHRPDSHAVIIRLDDCALDHHFDFYHSRTTQG